MSERLDDQVFRQILRDIPAPVVVLTAWEEPHRWRGMTASSMVSVSLSPPLLAVNVTVDTQMHEVLSATNHYTFNVLNRDQEALAMHFAQAGLTPEEQAGFAGVNAHVTPQGGVRLEGAAAWMHCRAYARFPVGDHTVFIGEVLEGDHAPQAEPLLYYQRRFCSLPR